MGRILFSFLLLLLGTNQYLLAQRQSNFWPLGIYGNVPPDSFWTMLDFGKQPLTVDSVNLPFNFTYSCSSVADTAGNLLAYTNGFLIANRNHEVMQGSSRMALHTPIMNEHFEWDRASWMASLMLPTQGINLVTTLYFTVDTVYAQHLTKWRTYYTATHLHYAVVDMTAAKGLGAVMSQDAVLVQDTLAGNITATRHANGRDWWVVAPTRFKRGYYTMLVNDSGPQAPMYQEFAPDPSFNLDSACGEPGQLWFTPQGDKLVQFDNSGDIKVYWFDRCTGALTPHQRFWTIWGYNDRSNPNLRHAGIMAISGNGHYLYTSLFPHLVQYDLTAPDIKATETVVDTGGYLPDSNCLANTGPIFYGFMFTGPDGKIYSPLCNYCQLKNGGIKSYRLISRIESPDSAGVTCQSNTNWYFTYNTYTDWWSTIPNHPNYRLGALPGTACDSLGLPAWYAGPIERVDTTVGVELPPSAGAGSGIGVWPNPAREQAMIALPAVGSGELRLLSATGSVVKLLTFNQVATLRLDLTGVPSGVYVCEVRTREGNMFTHKLVVLP